MITPTQKTAEIMDDRDTCRSVTHKFQLENWEAYLTVGVRPDGSPRYIDVKIAKEGTQVAGMMRLVCQLATRCLEHGMGAVELADVLKGHRFEPFTDEYRSIADYIGCWLDNHFAGA